MILSTNVSPFEPRLCCFENIFGLQEIQIVVYSALPMNQCTLEIKMTKIAAFLLCVILGLSQRLEALNNADPHPQYHSQALQDQFVHMMLYGLLGKQDQGYYLEIGAGEPICINNSYFFEKNLGWKGVSVDISEGLSQRWYAARNNLLLTEDALLSDYRTMLQSFPTVIDYLSLDIDAQYVDLLKKIPFDRYIFKVITIEHDFYRYGDIYREGEREILRSLGYHLLFSDVSFSGSSFEDWWIHPSFFPPSLFEILISLDLKGKDYQEGIRLLQDVMVSQ
ncbi:MAG: hypothetical protein ACD_17C00542G0004 [uncultured bacterium]|nr:MAG: hypothetical protein ACD_17C00542G0004 [uncultured bacterium]OGN56353.1 MAG: hypothetical protein A2796_02910 [Chlamydiae bacterium RIFCSPHIGHO2_01_FULL_44_39]OGN57886.1 MAG: hypothetical protein A3C42_02915 [Chlamydiae bacterium RIFCSPHIGHO2_02_FULL_45_9]OGN60255.1 MAG: hypothetical protein A3D96_05430 [Chlamydiae bacterium RIFCSPHIGHO2_12_FULL_44_59]OGN67092.1 MAG: hypothetical protein A2978_00615 [Chlamydiae bacterium RIFCSPLOWO2_01_FULL_44_52]OGN67682.1 MAG: hypothetical protein A3